MQSQYSFICQDLLQHLISTRVVSVYPGANDELEKQIATANQKCSMFFDMMKKDKEQALLLPPYEFEVCWAPFVSCALVRQQGNAQPQLSCNNCCFGQVAIKHKYGATVTCRVSVKFSGAEELRLLSCTFTLAGDHAKMGLLTAGALTSVVECWLVWLA